MSSEFVNISEDGVASALVSPRGGSVVALPVGQSDKGVSSQLVKAQMLQYQHGCLT